MPYPSQMNPTQQQQRRPTATRPRSPMPPLSRRRGACLRRRGSPAHDAPSFAFGRGRANAAASSSSTRTPVLLGLIALLSSQCLTVATGAAAFVPIAGTHAGAGAAAFVPGPMSPPSPTVVGMSSSPHKHRSPHSPIVLSAYTDGTDRTSAMSVPTTTGNAPATNANIPTTTKLPDAPKPKNKPVRVLPNGGRMTLVGSGPGSPDLLTLAAHRTITDPDAYVIVDRLVSDEIKDLIAGEYRVANKHPGCQHKAQEEIYEWVEEGLKEGRHVVRLKIGDPFVFGRGGEEVLYFRGLGVESTVIPGVSAAFSAPLLGSIPVTHRGVANQVVMCTGYGRENTSPSLIQYHPEQTVVFLMAVGRIRTLSERLVNVAGYPADTPVGIVERAGCPDQRTLVGTLESVGDVVDEFKVKAPSTIVVGEVVRVLLDGDETGGEAVVGLVQDCAASASAAAAAGVEVV